MNSHNLHKKVVRRQVVSTKDMVTHYLSPRGNAAPIIRRKTQSSHIGPRLYIMEKKVAVINCIRVGPIT